MIIHLFDYDDVDKGQIKFGFWMAIHHPFAYRGKFAYGQIRYSLAIIKRGIIKINRCEWNRGVMNG